MDEKKVTMKRRINMILEIISVVVYISVIIMKFFTTIDIPDSSFVIMSLLFIISAGQFGNAVKSLKE